MEEDLRARRRRVGVGSCAGAPAGTRTGGGEPGQSELAPEGRGARPRSAGGAFRGKPPRPHGPAGGGALDAGSTSNAAGSAAGGSTPDVVGPVAGGAPRSLGAGVAPPPESACAGGAVVTEEGNELGVGGLEALAPSPVARGSSGDGSVVTVIGPVGMVPSASGGITIGPIVRGAGPGGVVRVTVGRAEVVVGAAECGLVVVGAGDGALVVVGAGAGALVVVGAGDRGGRRGAGGGVDCAVSGS